MLEALKSEVLHFSKTSYQEGLFAGTSGNLSVFDPEQKLMVITPSGLSYETMTMDDLVVMQLDGSVKEGHRKPSSEWRLHKTVYEAKPGFHSVVHTHSPYATSFAVTRKKIPFVLIEMMLFLGGDIPVAEFAMAGTDEVGKTAVEALKNRYACLMANHGVLAIGKTIDKAHIAAVYVEDVAKIYSMALGHGNAVLLPTEVETAMRQKYGLRPDEP